MKRSLKAAVIAAVFASCAAAAHAETFDFSYTFADGLAITGSLDGTASGNLISNISNVNVDFGGNQFTGSLFAGTADNANGVFNYSANSAVLSTDSTLNNFIFSDGNDPTLGNTSNAFIFNAPGGYVDAFNTNVLTNSADFDEPANGSWEIAPEVKPVPVPGAFPLLLSGLGLLTAAARRRRAQAV
jgi:hypothetical protein